MKPDYDKVIEFFSEHETAIYGFGPTESERTNECTERCLTIETAKEHLANAHCDWCRPTGTGRIYCVTLVPTEDGSITRVSTMVYENNRSYQ